MTDPLGVLLVGAGRMGAVHLESLQRSQSTYCQAVVDPAADIRTDLESAGLDAYESLDEALRADSFDAALIAAPSDLHLPLVSALTAAGLPTLCEKPCGLESTQTEEAVELAARAGVLLQVGYWRRFVPELQQLRNRVRTGDLGEVSLIQAWQWDEEPPSAAFRARSGGINKDMGVHEFDQIRWITGEELAIEGSHACDVVSAEAIAGDPESSIVVCRLGGGGLALVSLGRRYQPGDSCWVELMGTQDTARAEFMAGPAGDEVFRQALIAQLDGFADAVAGRPTEAATAVDAVAALRAAEEAEYQ
ncbi:MAG: Gfo/Idh/MocA family oxidoreductase [Acidimicrobiales bacterium]